MDFITPIINFVWPFIKKALPYLIIVLLIAFIALLWHRLRMAQSDADAYRHNTGQLFQVANHMAQDIELNRRELRKIASLDSTIKALKIRPKYVTEIHDIKGETVYVDVVRFDTVGGIAHVPLNYGCISGHVTVAGDSAIVDVRNNLDLSIVSHLERPKGWFWKGEWNPKGWPINTVVVNKCDTSMVWEVNRRVRVR